MILCVTNQACLTAELRRVRRRVTQRGTKLQAPDGKSRLTDTLDSDGIIALAKHFPTNRAMKFLDWFLYSDTSEDGQSKKKAYMLFESNLIDD